MKKVLIITYYFPPVKGAAPWRPFSWAKEFKKYGLDPTVLTRHWVGTESHWDDFIKDNNTPLKFEKFDDYSIYHLPSKKNKLLMLFQNNLLKVGLFRKLFYTLMSLLGYLNLEVDAFLTFKSFIKKHLKENSYQFILITYPPSNILRLLPEVKKYSNAKIVLDVRDLWNNHALHYNYKPNLKLKINDMIYLHYSKKYINLCDLITVVTPSFIPLLQSITNKPISVIYNGFEAFIFKYLVKEKSSIFRISYIGNLYPDMDLKIITEGLNLFLSDKNPDTVVVNFIGLDSNPKMKAVITSQLPQQFLNLTKMLNKDEALKHTVNSDVLLHYGWKGFSGMIGTKTFDYIASGNNILMAPGDDDIVDDLLRKTETGKTAESSKAFNELLNNWYLEWQLNGCIKYNGVEKEIAFYSRENQAHMMANLINNL